MTGSVILREWIDCRCFVLSERVGHCELMVRQIARLPGFELTNYLHWFGTLRIMLLYFNTNKAISSVNVTVLKLRNEWSVYGIHGI